MFHEALQVAIDRARRGQDWTVYARVFDSCDHARKIADAGVSERGGRMASEGIDRYTDVRVACGLNVSSFISSSGCRYTRLQVRCFTFLRDSRESEVAPILELKTRTPLVHNNRHSMPAIEALEMVSDKLRTPSAAGLLVLPESEDNGSSGLEIEFKKAFDRGQDADYIVLVADP